MYSNKYRFKLCSYTTKTVIHSNEHSPSAQAHTEFFTGVGWADPEPTYNNCYKNHFMSINVTQPCLQLHLYTYKYMFHDCVQLRFFKSY